MQRGSDKHSPRVDEEMEREARSLTQGTPIESRVSEGRMKEPAGDEDPVPEQVIDDNRR